MKRLIPFLLVLSMLFTFTPTAYAAITPTTLNDNISGIYKQLAVTGIPVGKSSKVFFVDTVNGYDTNSGLSTDKPLKSVTAAEDKCVANRNDVVAMIGCATGDTVADTITWDKSYTHLVGLSGDLSTGQRCRIVGGAATDETTVITISGNGCIFKNIQFYNGGDVDQEAQAAVITGSRCYFENVFFAGMGHATSAAHVGGSSVQISGAENTFVNCTLGLSTLARTAATYEVIMTGECNRTTFTDCYFGCWSNTATSCLLQFTATAVPYTTIIKDCIFNNFCSNNGATGTAMNHAIIDGATPYHATLLTGSTIVEGCAAIVDVATYTFSAGPAPNAGAYIGAVTTT